MNDLRYGSLFSGIGGIDLGMDMAGFECAWQVEVDEHCRRILEKHWPEVPKYKDIYDVKGSELEPVDILCGGFPCQPVSLAGERAGVDDERWLWDEFYRLICEVRPRWVVVENVTGLLSANSGRAFAGVLRDLAEGGYDAVWDVYPAGGPGGVGAPHRRERIFIVAHTSISKPIKETRNVGEVSGVSQEDRKDIGSVVSGGGSKHVADTKGKRHGRRAGEERRIKEGKFQQSKQGRSKVGSEVERRSRPRRENVANPKRFRSQGQRKSVKSVNSKKKGDRETVEFVNGSFQNQWAVEPNVGRVADGVPDRMVRLKMLGNAVVPQVAYKVARMISEYTTKEK